MSSKKPSPVAEPPAKERIRSDSKPESPPESHTADRTDRTDKTPEPPLNEGAVYPEEHEFENRQLTGQEFAPKLARIQMDQIDAVTTPMGVVLFALSEGGDIWQYTAFSGQGQWTQILTPEVPAGDA